MDRPQPQMGTQDDVVIQRIVAWIIDAIVIGVATGVVVGVVSLISGRLAALLSPVFGLLAFAYFIYLEGTYGQTVGKRVLGLVVVMEDGSDCGMAASLVRNLLRIVDILPFFYLLGLVVIFLTDDNQRIGDIAADTVVVQAAG